jgi:hypothetical protein
MALETLKGIQEIGGFGVKRVDWDQPISNHVEINDRCNAITFSIQNGPIKENGVNGCQIDTLVETAKLIVEGLNSQYPSDYNRRAIKGLEDCLKAFSDRKADRERRNVEGQSKA